MNNNRNHNNNNRRRGRGNRNQSGGSPNQMNRIDSRSRGNAAQLLDKYKKLAQDAQHNGDRVQAEYYLQFADHYSRVISDNKARQDEARAKRSEEREPAGEASNDENEGGDDRNARGRRPRQPRNGGRDANRETGRENTRDNSRDDRNQGRNDGPAEGDRGDEGEAISSEDNAVPEEAPKKPRRTRAKAPATRKPRKPRESSVSSDEGGIDAGVLPPAISGDSDAKAAE